MRKGILQTDLDQENLAVLCEFLLLPAATDATEPPPLPPSLDGLPAALYLEAAVQYVRQYPFDREFYKYTPKTRQRYSYLPDSEWKDKARIYLEACIHVDRSGLAPLTSGSYDAAHEQQEFARKVIFSRRWKLEELASEMLALVEFIRYDTRTASPVRTPMDTGLPRNPTVVDQVRERDQKCRLTGVELVKSGATAEELEALEQAGRAFVPTLQVVHGLPFQLGKTTFALVTALTGIDCQDWATDSIGNAFLAHQQLHELFGSFKIFLEWTPDGQIIIRGRTGAGSPRLYLRMIVNDCLHPCHMPGELLDTPIRPRLNTSISDLDSKYFILHRFIGDIVWMCGGAEPVSDDDEDNMVVSATNIGMLMEKLQSPMMDFVPREQELLFGSRMVLVPKNQSALAG
ncbi:hypothetical protein DFH09DRAFT_543101 [Mycena vulgaris]|nr:hypothetical protein DFH09DRAFT_543101 [Mycena vulgaris]